MRGRKPTDPNLKLIMGTTRQDRGEPDAPEFEIVSDFPPPPIHLNADGAAMWNKLGPQLVAARVLQVVDLYALQQLCYAWQRMVKKQKADMDITAAEDTAFKALLSEFGMTPASRRKVTSSGDKKREGNRFGALGRPVAG